MWSAESSRGSVCAAVLSASRMRAAASSPMSMERKESPAEVREPKAPELGASASPAASMFMCSLFWAAGLVARERGRAAVLVVGVSSTAPGVAEFEFGTSMALICAVSSREVTNGPVSVVRVV